ncbi:protein-lysine N-methyltransferase SMYD4 [Dermatophagoides farinae]|uniref:protein-lysine N-methyltransferase SMYD4 n=1 Tax=Dermatophagoides farinae TaxID=6954 RepID=UPI003F63AE9A
MDFMNFHHHSIINQKDEKSWKQFATFVESIVAFLACNDQTKFLIDWIDEQRQQKTNNEDNILNELNENNEFKMVLSKYFDEYFFENVNIANDLYKNHERALEFFNNITTKMAEQKWSESLQLISNSIRFCCVNSDDNLLIQLYDKRSIVFYQLKQYHDCIMDIREILANNFNNNNQEKSSMIKFYLRMAQATVNINDQWEDLNMLSNIINDCRSIMDILNEKERTQMEKLLTLMDSILNKKCEELSNRKSNDNDKTKSMNLMDLKIHSPHPIIRGASNKLAITWIDAQTKRGYTAQENIDEGELIFKEKPFVCHFFDHTTDSYCGNCLRRLCNPIFNDSEEKMEEDEDTNDRKPEELSDFEKEYNHFVPCTSCSKFIFCSRKCRDEAYRSFHQRECNHSLIPLESEIGIAYIVVRLVCRSFNSFIELAKKQTTDIIDETNLQQSLDGNYGSIVRLLTHADKHDSDSKTCFLLTAFFLQHVFKRYKMFDDDGDCFYSSIDILKLLIHHLQQMSTNLITIFDQNLDLENIDNCIESPIGIGLYPNLALFNHSCDPDIVPIYNKGSELIFKTIRKISKNKEIFFSYGPTYKTTCVYQRQKLLHEQYFFHCHCMACMEKRENYDSAILCPTCFKPSFIDCLDTTKEKKYFLICQNGHRYDDIEPIKQEILRGIQYQKAGLHFYELAVDRNDDDDYVAAIISFYKADVIFTNTLYCLNTFWLSLKRQMINCYVKMGHNDRAVIYCRQIISSFYKHSIQNEQLPILIMEKIRLIKILRLLIEEIDDDDDELRRLRRELKGLIDYCLNYVELINQNDLKMLREQKQQQQQSALM